MTLPTPPGAVRIQAARTHQIVDKGYAPENDIGRSKELQQAAYAYLNWVSARDVGVELPPEMLGWPWDPDSFHPNPEDPSKTLAKAGALIAAAIDARVTENAHGN